MTDLVTFGAPDVPGSRPEIYGANVLRLRDPDDPVPHGVVGIIPPVGLAQNLYSLLHPDTNGHETTFTADGGTDGWNKFQDVHGNKATYVSIGRQFDESDEVSLRPHKESMRRYFNGTVDYDTNA